MIDASGFRPNVGIVLLNDRHQVFWAKRVGHDAWQFPQGGIQQNESPEAALFRELREETGLSPEHVEVLAATRGWLYYYLPKPMIRGGSQPVCIGQKQKWFLLKMKAPDDAIQLDCAKHPEFDDWRWVSYWYPVGEIINFKRDVYRRALKEFARKSFAESLA